MSSTCEGLCAWNFHTALSIYSLFAEHHFVHQIVQNCHSSQPQVLPPSSVDSTVNVPSVPVDLQLSTLAPPWWPSLYFTLRFISCQETIENEAPL